MVNVVQETPAVGEEAAAGTPLNRNSEIGRRDRKKHATRQALRNAALQLVAERGFAHVTVEDIAEAADVATRTFFNYFPSKESAVIGADPDRVVQLKSSLLARPLQESPLEAVGSVLVEYAATIEQELASCGRIRSFSVLTPRTSPRSSGYLPRPSRSVSARTRLTTRIPPS